MNGNKVNGNKAQASDKIQLFIISQQSLFRQGIEHSLENFGGIEVVLTTEINDSVLSTIDTQAPDVIIIDIDGSIESGLSLARRIKQRAPNIGIIVLTSSPADEQLFQALKNQAAAYFSKEVTADKLAETVRRVARGEHPINESLTASPRVAEKVLLQFQELSRKTEAEAFLSPLTTREMEILKCMGQGMLNKQIAVEVGISEQTIKNHVTSILRKLNANARTEAVVVAIKQGLLTIEQTVRTDK